MFLTVSNHVTVSASTCRKLLISAFCTFCHVLSPARRIIFPQVRMCLTRTIACSVLHVWTNNLRHCPECICENGLLLNLCSLQVKFFYIIRLLFTAIQTTPRLSSATKPLLNHRPTVLISNCNYILVHFEISVFGNKQQKVRLAFFD